MFWTHFCISSLSAFSPGKRQISMDRCSPSCRGSQKSADFASCHLFGPAKRLGLSVFLQAQRNVGDLDSEGLPKKHPLRTSGVLGSASETKTSSLQNLKTLDPISLEQACQLGRNKQESYPKNN